MPITNHGKPTSHHFLFADNPLGAANLAIGPLDRCIRLKSSFDM
jgi:hypothetical protein